ncbi:MaoC/PaaZ C-terminal domain-containing protein [Bosea sp. (in: a-proteobacteria)]|uniref:MaoC/PaaZ C-terminal domain-containing protein n=1 Tax=Bosea sp. (in: a-proteobacteria) TaxID=1871050 RepID=UPI00262D3A04|nr:MaoC/PaaZ C-terminal domain-containing protein [Bosea sp. (in: a-proteobacteria)]MCO5089660.1 MaoC family dehydratase N-terminal domain-containing protein [Bosea sp. (in: a-proteobacteria)]
MADTHTLYYEDIEAGRVFVSTGRTVTEADSTMFCMLSGDWNPLHCDEEFARSTPFGKRVVGGIFGITLLTGMFTRWGVFELSALAMLSLDNWKFHAPILIGDTLHVRMTITGKRLTSKPGRGVIERFFEIVNQNGVVTQSGDSAMLIACRPDEAMAAAG